MMATVTPSAARVLAMTRPMPRPAPVTMATLPLRSISMSDHRAQEGFAGKVRGDIGNDEVPHFVARLVGGAALVGRQDDIVEAEETLGHLRLLLEHVERGATELLRCQQL